MFGNFNSSGSCLKKKKEESGFIYSMYSNRRLPQIAFLLSERIIFLAPSLPPPPSAHHTCHLQQPPFACFTSSFSPHLQIAFPIFFLTTPLTSWKTDAGSNYEKTTIVKEKKIVKQLLFLFFFSASNYVTCLASDNFWRQHWLLYKGAQLFAFIDIHKNEASK